MPGSLAKTFFAATVFLDPNKHVSNGSDEHPEGAEGADRKAPDGNRFRAHPEEQHAPNDEQCVASESKSQVHPREVPQYCPYPLSAGSCPNALSGSRCWLDGHLFELCLLLRFVPEQSEAGEGVDKFGECQRRRVRSTPR